MTSLLETVSGRPLKSSPFGILSSASTVVNDPKVHWEGGFSYDSDGYVTVSNISSHSNTVSSIVSSPSSGFTLQNEYIPFIVEVSTRVSTMGTNTEQIEEDVLEALDIATQKAVEREFWTGEITKQLVLLGQDVPNRYLASSNAVDVTPTPGSAVRPRYGIALLEKALGDFGYGQLGTIHVTKGVGSALPLVKTDNHLESIIGTPFVVGSGYRGTSPAGASPSGTTVWAYATGPVTVRLGAVSVYQKKLKEAINISRNTVEYKAYRAASVTWNGDALFGVLIDLSMDYS